MTWQQFCAWCTKNGFNPPTVIKGVSGRDSYPYYVPVSYTHLTLPTT